MVRIHTLMIAIAGGLFLAKPALCDNSQPQTMGISVSRALAPVGYDDNDRVQFAVLGKFASDCYRVGPHAFHLDVSARKIIVQQQAYLYPGPCVQIPIPFSEIITVGLVPPGRYAIIDYASGNTVGTVTIAQASHSEPDGYLYAPISDAYLVDSASSPKHAMKIVGYFHDSCSALDQMLVTYSSDSVVIQPTVRRDTSRSCQPAKIRFERSVPLKEDLHGTYLFQVRVESGQAINKVLYVE